MGIIKEHPPVQLFAAITFNERVDLKEVFAHLQNLSGAIEERSALFDFDAFTDYYESEMGSGLEKLFITFKELIHPETLPDIKRQTNQIELEISKSKQRCVNIDPGYLTVSKVVLATTKDYAHRLYLGKGIYGDLHLVYQKKSFRAQPWTYPDYRQPLAIEFFNRLRETYRDKLEQFLSSTGK
ncbi:DUF4416 family protein [Calditrichota bacterium LG25]